MRSLLALRLGAALLWVSGVGFGLPCVAAIRSLRAGRGIPFILGFPAYGQGPFEQHGFATTVPLVAGFLVICIAEIVAGLVVWNGNRTGGILALSLLPLEAFYWWGFALPIPPILAVARTMLILSAWRALS